MAAISHMTLSNAFSWMKMLEFRLKFRWILFIRGQLTTFQHWFRWWLGADQAPSHYLNKWWLDYRRIYASLGLNELICIDNTGWNCHKQDDIMPWKDFQPNREFTDDLDVFVVVKLSKLVSKQSICQDSRRHEGQWRHCYGTPEVTSVEWLETMSTRAGNH